MWAGGSCLCRGLGLWCGGDVNDSVMMGFGFFIADVFVIADVSLAFWSDFRVLILVS